MNTPINNPEELARVLSEQLDDESPLHLNSRWLPLAERLWDRMFTDAEPTESAAAEMGITDRKPTREDLLRETIRLGGELQKVITAMNEFYGLPSALFGALSKEKHNIREKLNELNRQFGELQ